MKIFCLCDSNYRNKGSNGYREFQIKLILSYKYVDDVIMTLWWLVFMTNIIINWYFEYVKDLCCNMWIWYLIVGSDIYLYIDLFG